MGHSEGLVKVSRRNVPAVSLKGLMSWDSAALFLMVILWQSLLSLSYSYSYSYSCSLVHLWLCVFLAFFYRTGPLLEPQNLQKPL